MQVPCSWSRFRSVWVCDFEFNARDGELPSPICCVARNVTTGEVVRLWQDDLARVSAPYGVGPEDMFVAYFASAEAACHLALNWRMPTWVMDLYAEFRVLTNGRSLPCGRGLLGACAFYGLPFTDVEEKGSMRALALRGGPYTSAESAALLDYCQHDVDATVALFKHMQPLIDLPRALLRGRFMVACARIERTGIPIDVSTLDQLRESWDDIRQSLVATIDTKYGVYDGTTFKVERFKQYLKAHDIPWESLPSGQLKLDDDTFRERARAFPELNSLRELRSSLSKLRLADLAVGPDGRNRTMLSPFAAKTGRNAPSTTKQVFGPSTWLRHLVRPEPGNALAYIDWSQQEFGIAAALSGDARMLEAYSSGDPYLSFAKQAGAAPPDATKQSHAEVREQFKACTLATQYGMGAETLARRTGLSTAHAEQLLVLHRRTYPDYWKWADGVVAYAMLNNRIYSIFGWTLQVDEQLGSRTIQNYPMQANGAEMLRLACCRTTEAGVHVCMPVHDALLIEAPVSEIDETVELVQQTMAWASRVTLGGVELRSSVTRIMYPDRYADPRGVEMWRTVMAVLKEHAGAQVDREEVCA